MTSLPGPTACPVHMHTIRNLTLKASEQSATQARSASTSARARPGRAMSKPARCPAAGSPVEGELGVPKADTRYGNLLKRGTSGKRAAALARLPVQVRLLTKQSGGEPRLGGAPAGARLATLLGPSRHRWPPAGWRSLPSCGRYSHHVADRYQFTNGGRGALLLGRPGRLPPPSGCARVCTPQTPCKSSDRCSSSRSTGGEVGDADKTVATPAALPPAACRQRLALAEPLVFAAAAPLRSPRHAVTGCAHSPGPMILSAQPLAWRHAGCCRPARHPCGSGVRTGGAAVRSHARVRRRGGFAAARCIRCSCERHTGKDS